MNTPLIIAFVSDLYFSSRIERVAEQVGFSSRIFSGSDDVLINQPKVWVRQFAEHLDGQGGVLLELLTKSQPALIIFDLNNEDIPWQNWIALIKSAPATRRIPVLAFGSHIEGEKFQKAKGAGTDRVVARSKFVNDLAQLIEMYALDQNIEGIESACTKSLSEIAIKGLQEFNRGEYYEAHEYLEQAWMEDTSQGRELYRAILQIAVAYLQIQRRNYRGTMKMFLRVRQWLDPLPDICRGVNVAKLRAESEKVQETIKSLGEKGMEKFDHGLLKPIEYSL